MTRVKLLWTALFALAPLGVPASTQIPQTPLPGKSIPRYVDALPTFVGSRVDGTHSLTVTMKEFPQQILPGTFPATTVWGYEITDDMTSSVHPLHYPAATIEAWRNTPTTVDYVNALVDPVLQKVLTVDQTLHWADPGGLMCSTKVPPVDCMTDPEDPCCQPYSGPVPAAVHLHGGEVPSAFDGGPDAWFTPFGATGPGYVTNVYTYPNGQEPTTMFFHDHALGATRLNLYAGLVGFYLLRGDGDTGVEMPGGLSAGPFEIEMAIQDKQFDTEGRLFFPDGSHGGLNGPPPNPDLHPFWSPEFFGDAIVVNGKTWPFLDVEPRRYRFRIVDGSNARFFELRLENRATNQPGPALWQIGTDGGLLDAPVMLNDPAGPERAVRLLIAPGERADVIIDFSGYDGQTLTLVNSAKAPYPSGTPPNPATVGEIMQFRVVQPLSGTDTSFDPASGASLRGGPGQQAPIVRLADGAGGLAPGVVPDKVRQLTLNEVEGPGGPEEVILNNSKWGAASTENPRVGSTEVWEIVNTTADAHPIHVHELQFQLINRQNYNRTRYLKAYAAAFPGGAYVPASGPPLAYATQQTCSPAHPVVIGGNPCVDPYLQGPAKAPDANEIGWKDTFKMYPGQVTRVVIRWAQQDVPVELVSAGTNTFPFDPTAPMGTTDGFGFPGGPGYVWHCHIVDHEDNEMMRPYHVMP